MVYVECVKGGGAPGGALPLRGGSQRWSRRSADFMRQLKESKRPVVITVTGRAAAMHHYFWLNGNNRVAGVLQAAGWPVEARSLGNVEIGNFDAPAMVILSDLYGFRRETAPDWRPHRRRVEHGEPASLSLSHVARGQFRRRFAIHLIPVRWFQGCSTIV